MRTYGHDRRTCGVELSAGPRLETAVCGLLLKLSLSMREHLRYYVGYSPVVCGMFLIIRKRGKVGYNPSCIRVEQEAQNQRLQAGKAMIATPASCTKHSLFRIARYHHAIHPTRYPYRGCTYITFEPSMYLTCPSSRAKKTFAPITFQ